MYGLLQSIIGYTGSYNNYDSYLVYGSIAITILLLGIFIDLLYRLLRSFIRK